MASIRPTIMVFQRSSLKAAIFAAVLVFISLAGTPSLADGDEGGVEYRDTPETTRLWEVINRKDDEGLLDVLMRNKYLAHARSADGRGGAWWAWEYANEFALSALIASGDDVFKTDEDLSANTPISLCQQNTGDEECKTIGENAKIGAEGVKNKIKEREAAKRELEADDYDDDEDDSIDDDEF